MSKPDLIRPWKTLASEMALDHPWYRVRKDQVELPDGQVLDDYYTSERPEIVLVFPLTPEGEVITVRQYKHGAGEILLEFPGGIHAGDQLQASAERELLEETGYVAGHWTYLGAVWDDAAKQNNRLHLYLAEGAELVQEQSLDSSEFITVERYPVAEVAAMIGRGEIATAGALALACLATMSLQSAE